MSYNRDNVVSYAKQYAYNYNPNYIDYATYEGSSDCANFVSQCLYAGGIAMTDTWYYRYPGYSSPSVSTAWRGAQSLRRFVQSLDVVLLDDPTSLKRGDVIFTLDSGTSAKSLRNANHAVIVSRDVGSDGNIYVYGHDTDKNDEIRRRSGETSDWNSLFVHINDGTSSGGGGTGGEDYEYFDEEDRRTAMLDFGTRTLKYVSGSLMHGTDVENVQTRLSYLAYDPGSIDGYFGKNTETAVKNFQQYAGPFLGGLNVDGIVGAATKEALRHPAID